MIFLNYSKWTTCRKAKSWLEDNGADFDNRDIISKNPSSDELYSWIEKYNKNIDDFFNKRGVLYRELNLKEKITKMTLDEKISLLSSDGKLVKRPILITDSDILFGFNDDEWSNAIK